MLEVIVWWYNWGLFLFLFLDLIAVFGIFLGSARRRGVDALAWRMGAIVPTLLVLPSFFLKFAPSEILIQMIPLIEPFFWLGLISGLIPIILAIVYALTVGTRPAAGPPPYPVQQPPYPVQQPPYPVQQPPYPVQQPVQQPRPVQIKPKANGWFYVQSGPAAGRSFQLNVGDTRLGRSPDNDLSLNDPEISKGHALVRAQGGQITIQDLGSTNGTFVNGQRLYSVQMLYDGDIVRLGQTTLVFKHAG